MSLVIGLMIALLGGGIVYDTQNESKTVNEKREFLIKCIDKGVNKKDCIDFANEK